MYPACRCGGVLTQRFPVFLFFGPLCKRNNSTHESCLHHLRVLRVLRGKKSLPPTGPGLLASAPSSRREGAGGSSLFLVGAPVALAGGELSILYSGLAPRASRAPKNTKPPYLTGEIINLSSIRKSKIKNRKSLKIPHLGGTRMQTPFVAYPLRKKAQEKKR